MKKLVVAGLLVALTGCNVTIHTLPKTTGTITPVETVGTTLDIAPVFDAVEDEPIIVQEWGSSFLSTAYAYRETLTIDGDGYWEVVRSYTQRYDSHPEVVASGYIGYRGVKTLVEEAFERASYTGTRFVDLSAQEEEDIFSFRSITLNLNRGSIRIEDPGSEEYPCAVFDSFAEAIAQQTADLPYNEDKW